METQKKKIIYSGIQPSGTLTLGNYIGAIRNWDKLQDEYDCIYGVVDMHAITVRQDSAVLRRRCLETVALLMACGIDTKRSILYCQSHVHQHAELAWVLSCFTYMGELSRMTQFKDKSQKHEDNINAGLFTYPVLMAADILLYQSDLVPVGEDQRQHMELARDVALRFNNLYPNTFVVPEAYIPKLGGRVMSLSEPRSKMSKSDEEPSYIAILDEPDAIRRKFRRAVTDMQGVVRYDAQEQPGIANMINIYAALSALAPDEIVAQFEGKGYGAFKDAVADVVIEALRPIREKYSEYIADKAMLQALLKDNAQAAGRLAERTMRKVRKKIGFAPLED